MITAKTKPIEKDHARDLRAHFNGEIILPSDDGYDLARRVWNGMIDRYPGMIVRPRDVDDVVAAVNFARQNDQRIAVRGGAHNVAGLATIDDGIVIDLSLLKGIEVDPRKRIARAGAGVIWGELDAATRPYGLITPGGVVSDTGIAGLTLGGGMGWVRNKFGLSADNLIAAQMVTADGRIVRASEHENSDLLWGLRGGGGNFGIVTQFEYRLHELGPDVNFAFVFHHGKWAEEGLRFFREYTQSAPDEVAALAFLGVFPPGVEAFPEEVHGLPFIAFGAMYAGSPEEGESVLAPLREFSQPLVDFSGVMPYVDAQVIFDEDYPKYEMRYYWKSTNLMNLDDQAIRRIVEHAQKQPSAHSTTDLWHIGGAIKRVSPDESAYGGRHANYVLNPEANWERPEHDDANLAWVRDFIAAMQEFSDGGSYLNFPGFLEEGDELVQRSFGQQYARLAALKAKYDPHNFFSLNQNIKPAG